MEADSYVQYKAMVICTGMHLLLLMFELLACDKLESNRRQVGAGSSSNIYFFEGPFRLIYSDTKADSNSAWLELDCIIVHNHCCPPTKFTKSNVFSRVRLAVCLHRKGGFHVTITHDVIGKPRVTRGASLPALDMFNLVHLDLTIQGPLPRHFQTCLLCRRLVVLDWNALLIPAPTM